MLISLFWESSFLGAFGFGRHAFMPESVLMGREERLKLVTCCPQSNGAAKRVACAAPVAPQQS